MTSTVYTVTSHNSVNRRCWLNHITNTTRGQTEQFRWPTGNHFHWRNNLHVINYEPKRQLSPFADAVGTDNSSDDQLPGSIFFRFTSTFVPIRFTRLLLGSITYTDRRMFTMATNAARPSKPQPNRLYSAWNIHYIIYEQKVAFTVLAQ